MMTKMVPTIRTITIDTMAKMIIMAIIFFAPDPAAELVWRTNIAVEGLPMIKRIELFSTRKFVAVALGDNDKDFVARF